MKEEVHSKSMMKRKKPTVDPGDEVTTEVTADQDRETSAAMVVGSEEMEMSLGRLCQRIELFTQQVSELLEAGKKIFKDLSDEFEQKMIRIHQEQVEKWTQEINELRALDSANEEINSRLHGIQFLMKNVRGEF